MTRHLGKGIALLFVAALVTAAAGGCGGIISKPPGVTPPPDEVRDVKPQTMDELVKTSTKNLSFDKKTRTLKAAENLGKRGAESASAIPELRRLINLEPDPESGFPDDEQKAAYKAALEKIIADMNAKGIAVPAEGASAPAGGSDAK